MIGEDFYFVKNDWWCLGINYVRMTWLVRYIPQYLVSIRISLPMSFFLQTIVHIKNERKQKFTSPLTSVW